MFHGWNQALRVKSFVGRFPNINPAWCWEQRERLIWTYYVFPIIRRPGFMIIQPTFSSFSVVFSNKRFSNYGSTVDVGFVKFSSDCFCGTPSSRWILSSVVTCAATVLWFLDTVVFNVWRSLAPSFGFRPLFLLADDFPWFVYAVILWKPLLWVHLTKWLFWLQATVKCAPTMCPLRKLDKTPILRYFHMNCY